MTVLDELETALRAATSEVDRDTGAATALAARGKAARAAADRADELAATATEAARLLASFADARQAKVTEAIEGICSAGLTAVFAEPMHLVLRQTVRAKRPEVDVLLRDARGLETPILEARGGGVAAVAGFLLRWTVLLLTRGARRLIVADEPFAHLSAQYSTPAAEFCRDLAARTGTQLIFVTHDAEFAEAADRLVEVTSSAGRSSARVLK